MSNSSDRNRADRLSIMIFVSAVVMTLAIIAGQSILALLYLLTDGTIVLVVVSAATVFGMLPMLLWRYPGHCPVSWQIMLGAGAGLGVLSLGMLALGSLGLLSRLVVLVCLCTMGILGLAGLGAHLRRSRAAHPEAIDDRSVRRFCRANLLNLALIPAAAMAGLAATVPPGILWSEEGFGYDVLEYHLQVPKEYFVAGRIEYLPHNIYSNFPMNAEMLYLLAMVLKNDPVQAAIMAKYFNALLGVLFVLAGWLVGRQYNPLCGALCALICGSAPWLMYLCGVAYVENGMLFYGMLSVGCLCRMEQLVRLGQSTSGFALVAGCFAGLSCGFKYIAVPMIAIPLLAALVVYSALSRAVPTGRVCVGFALGAVCTFAPWLIKNTVYTNNPVFPLAYELIGARAGIWDDALAHRWADAHAADSQHEGLFRRVVQLKARVLTEPRLGLTQDLSETSNLRWLILPLPLLLIVLTLLSPGRSQWDVLLFCVFIAQIAVWTFATHLFARFAVVVLIPLSILMARSALLSRQRWYQLTIVSIVLVTTGMNLRYSLHLLRGHIQAPLYGAMDLFYESGGDHETPLSYISNELSDDPRVLMVGDARAFYYPPNVDYCVVFSRNPFAESVATAQTDEDIIRWLNEQHYRYLLVNRSEIRRLAHTYGFWPELGPALFDRLQLTGLAPVKFFLDHRDRVYAVLYEVRRLRS